MTFEDGIVTAGLLMGAAGLAAAMWLLSGGLERRAAKRRRRAFRGTVTPR